MTQEQLNEILSLNKNQFEWRLTGMRFKGLKRDQEAFLRKQWESSHTIKIPPNRGTYVPISENKIIYEP